MYRRALGVFAGICSSGRVDVGVVDEVIGTEIAEVEGAHLSRCCMLVKVSLPLSWLAE